MSNEIQADANLLALSVALELAIDNERAILAALPAVSDGDIDNKVIDALCGPASAICSLIEAQKATTAAGWAVKARAWAFIQGSEDGLAAAA